MRLAATGTTGRPLPGGRPPRLSDDVVRRVRWRLLGSLGLAALAAALTGDVLALVADRSHPDPVTCLLAQLPVLAVVAMECCWKGRSHPTPLGSLVELGARAERAEEALVREHERMHEMRATLAGVSASHRVLRDPCSQLSPHRRRHLERLHDAEMGRLARLLAGQPQPAGPVDLDAELAPLAEASALLGSPVAWSPSGCLVHGRPDSVAEALHVLLENARRHAAGQDVEVTVVGRGDEVEVRVTDHGPGVDADVLPRLFQRRARGAQSPGDGLGLSIAQRLAREMGGRLGLESHLPGGHGATFVLTLPVASSGPQECLAASG
ncbi:sensor histidine kinase [Nocardioides pyridinolyticus]